MAAEHVHGDEPLFATPALTLDALRQAVAAVAPARMSEFFREIQDAFIQAGNDDSIFLIRHFGSAGYKIWATKAISRDSVGTGELVPAGMILPPVAAAINELAGTLGYDEQADSEVEWSIVGSPETWRSVLDGQANLYTLLRRCDLRYGPSEDDSPLVAQTRVAVLADLLGLSSLEPASYTPPYLAAAAAAAAP